MQSGKQSGNGASSLKFVAEIIKVQTMESGAIRLTLDLPEHETVLMAKLAECKRMGAVLEVSATALINNKDQGNAIQEGNERKSVWSPAKE